MISLEDKIWFCAFYEGEGSISNDKSNYNHIRISISQNDITPLELGKKLWGGFIRNRIRQSKNKTCYGNEWIMNRPQAIKFIEDIKPYMKIPYKIQQIENALELAKKSYERKFKCFFVNQNMLTLRLEEDTKKNHIFKIINFINVHIVKKILLQDLI